MIDGNGTIRTTPGPHLLNEGDVIAFPQKGWVGQITKVTDLGIRLEHWTVGGFDGGEIVLSWEQLFNWSTDVRIWGDGYLLDAALRQVSLAIDRRAAEEEQAKAGLSAPDAGQE